MQALSNPHRRWNPLREEWILVSPQRINRPWQGAVEASETEKLPQHDPECYLCPKNSRKGGNVNPDYKDTYVFDNDFPAVMPESGDGSFSLLNGIVRAEEEEGLCRVVCFSPRHDLTIPDLEVREIKKIIDTWANEWDLLRSKKEITHMLAFENKGAMMGCSNPHPHGQIWATKTPPNAAFRELNAQTAHFRKNGEPLLRDYLSWELDQKDRIISENDHWAALVPFWAVWPFEVMVIPKRNVAKIVDMKPEEREAWAATYKDVTIRYDNLFQSSFPYSMGIFQSMLSCTDDRPFILHQLFQPPLLRSSTVRKYMSGYEMFGEPQRDITPEHAAETLRAASTKLYRAN